jgi:hypothetical protein
MMIYNNSHLIIVHEIFLVQSPPNLCMILQENVVRRWKDQFYMRNQHSNMIY